MLLVVMLMAVAFENRSTGARSIGMAGTGVALIGAESIFLNQAAMAKVSGLTFLTVYESKFFLKEFSFEAIGAIVPSSLGSFGLSYSRFGKVLYRENKAGIAYSRRFSDFLSAGVQFSYLSNVLPENRDPFYSVTFEGGLLLSISDRLSGAVHFFNPFGSTINTPNGKIKIPWAFRIGEAWKVSPQLLWCVEAEKKQQTNWVIRTGLEYYPVETVAFRIGASGNPFRPTGGMGFHFRKFVFDIGFSYHGNLGYSPTAGISYSL